MELHPPDEDDESSVHGEDQLTLCIYSLLHQELLQVLDIVNIMTIRNVLIHIVQKKKFAALTFTSEAFLNMMKNYTRFFFFITTTSNIY